jgi:hypothetical protein
MLRVGTRATRVRGGHGKWLLPASAPSKTSPGARRSTPPWRCPAEPRWPKDPADSLWILPSVERTAFGLDDAPQSGRCEDLLAAAWVTTSTSPLPRSPAPEAAPGNHLREANPDECCGLDGPAAGPGTRDTRLDDGLDVCRAEQDARRSGGLATTDGPRRGGQRTEQQGLPARLRTRTLKPGTSTEHRRPDWCINWSSLRDPKQNPRTYGLAREPPAPTGRRRGKGGSGTDLANHRSVGPVIRVEAPGPSPLTRTCHQPLPSLQSRPTRPFRNPNGARSANRSTSA